MYSVVGQLLGPSLRRGGGSAGTSRRPGAVRAGPRLSVKVPWFPAGIGSAAFPRAHSFKAHSPCPPPRAATLLSPALGVSDLLSFCLLCTVLGPSHGSRSCRLACLWHGALLSASDP